MLRYKGISILEYWKLRRIARKVRAGIVPEGVDPETILRAMKLTKPKNVLEIMGLLSAKVQKLDGTFKDYGLVSVKSVTTVFAEYLVDMLTSSGEPATGPMDAFHSHKMGAGSTAEADDDTTLVTQQDGAQDGDGAAVATHGAQSSIYVTIGTLTAGSNYGCREHGVFNASTGGTLLDRSVVTNIELSTDDIVTWTYSLTVTPGG
jgi:hypothetical protein